MKKIIAAILIAAAGYFIWTSPIAGQWLYSNATDAEAAFYGFEEQSIDIGELKMSAYVGGPTDKPAIVMIHGYSADKDNWPRFAKHFVNDYRVVIPDLAGHGDTGFEPTWDYSAPAQAKRVAALLDKLGIEQAHITGNSMGGFITAWFARLYPERTLSAAPMDPAGIDSPIPSDMDKMLAAGKNPFFIQSPEDFKRFFPMSMEQPPFLPPSILAAMAKQYQQRMPELQAINKGFVQKNWLTNELQHIQAPTLVMWGEQDRLLHVSAAQVWVEKLPNATLKTFKGVGHMPMVEIPTEAATAYSNFLKQLN